MKAALSVKKSKLYHVVNGHRISGACSGLSGDCTDLYGDLRGDCTGLYGDCTGLYGDCTALRGDCTALRGNIDDCELSDAERKAGVEIQTLVKKDC